MKEIKLCTFSELEEKKPLGKQINGLDLVVIRYGENVSVLYGRCLHRGALMADGHIDGDNIICGVHNWNYRIDTGVSEYNNAEALHKFYAVIKDGDVYVDEDEINEYNTIEHEILRKDFEEPRIHFAINCASFSCPKLRNEAFTSAKLETQLEEQAADFINNSDKNIINEKATKLSKIFDWFQSDFTKKADLSAFIQKYKPTLNKNNKVEYIEYDWTLNE